MVYEGARSVTGPLLALLGAPAVLVGLVSGAGEAMALLLRLVSGTWADRTRRYWTFTVAGYAVTAVAVPALAVTPFLGAAGLAVGCALILLERAAKAIRSPAKTALLAHAAGRVGLGRGFAVHKALDQLGAVAGPLLVAAVAAVAGTLWPALAVLVLPGGIALLVLARLRRSLGEPIDRPTPASTGPARVGPDPDDRVTTGRAAAGPDPDDRVTTGPDPTPSAPARPGPAASQPRLPALFWWFAAAAGAATAGLVTFAVIAFHLTAEHLLPVAAVPLVYAGAMGAEALAALATGWLFDRVHGRVLLVLPLLVAAVPVLAFTRSVPLVMVGVLCWGFANGLQDSTVKALVAELVPADRRARAYGVFAAVQGAAAVAGGGMAGALYERSLPLLVAVVAATQVAALVLLVVTLRREPHRTCSA